MLVFIVCRHSMWAGAKRTIPLTNGEPPWPRATVSLGRPGGPPPAPGGFVSRLLPSVPSGVVDSGNHPLTAEQYRYAMTHREGVR